MNEQNAANVLEQQDGPNPQDNAEETSPVVEKTDAEGNPQADANDHDDETQGGKRLGGWQRKIRKLEQELEVWREQALKTRSAQPEQQAQPVADKPPVKPKIGDFTGANAWDEYESAKDKYYEDLADYKAKQEASKVRAELRQQAQQQTVADGWAAKVAEAKADPAMPDFEKIAFQKDLMISQPMADAIVDSEYGAHIAYELGKNPDEAERIANLSPIAATREIGRMEAKIESRIANKTAAAENPTATTKAPRPVSTVRRPSASNSEPSDDDDYKTWLKKREAQLRAR